MSRKNHFGSSSGKKLCLVLLLGLILIYLITKSSKFSNLSSESSGLLSQLKVYEFNQKKRIGSNEDGGYVIGDIGDVYDCYISAGISTEESFSRDFLNLYNVTESYGFDGTVEDYPYEYTDKVKFIKKNINSFNDKNNTDLSFLTNKYKSIFLKMDIEGGEFPWMLNITEKQLKNFKQIVIEFHYITNKDKTDTAIKCIEKLNKFFYLIHVHGNNGCGTENGIPNVIELTFINKNYFKTTPNLNKTPLPIENLDFSNLKDVPDIPLNFYPFTN